MKISHTHSSSFKEPFDFWWGDKMTRRMIYRQLLGKHLSEALKDESATSKKKQFKIIFTGCHFVEWPRSNDDARFLRCDLGDNEENEICSADGFMLLHRQLVWLKQADVVSPTEAPSYSHVSRPQGLLPCIPYESSTGPKCSSFCLGINKYGLSPQKFGYWSRWGYSAEWFDHTHIPAGNHDTTGTHVWIQMKTKRTMQIMCFELR